MVVVVGSGVVLVVGSGVVVVVVCGWVVLVWVVLVLVGEGVVLDVSFRSHLFNIGGIGCATTLQFPSKPSP